MPRINQAGLDLIKSFEGCVLYAYDDANDNRIMPGDPVEGTLTIGYGHTGQDVRPGETITQQQADELLQNDLVQFEAGVNAMVDRNLTPNQFAALVSFSYNLGLESLRGSTLLSYVNAGDFDAAQEQFGRWVYANGGELAGLVRRRAAEAALFGTP